MAVKCFLEKVLDDSLSCVLHRNSTRLPKMAGKCFFDKTHQMTLPTPCGSKISSKIALTGTIRYVFVFYAEIQDGCQKQWENDFWQIVPYDCA